MEITVLCGDPTTSCGDFIIKKVKIALFIIIKVVLCLLVLLYYLYYNTVILLYYFFNFYFICSMRKEGKSLQNYITLLFLLNNVLINRC